MTNREAWDFSLGMLELEGIEPTEEFKRLMEQEKRGEITKDEMLKILGRKYRMKEKHEDRGI